MIVTVIVSATSNLGTSLIAREEFEAENPIEIDLKYCIGQCMQTIENHNSDKEYFKIQHITTQGGSYGKERENYIYP